MGFAYRCDKCHQLTENQIVLCPSCALNAKEAGQPDAQQLKLAIAALIPGIVTSFTLGDEKQFITLTNELRQLTSN